MSATEEAASANDIVMATDASAEAQNCDDGTDAKDTAKQPEAEPPASPLIQKYEECWKSVQETPSDFTQWTTLIAAAEKIGDIERTRKAFESFLKYFPLCYGYWKKFADAEARHDPTAPGRSLQVFEQGVSATPYSADLWIHYATFKKANTDSLDDVRSIFERGLGFNGTDFMAHGLWDKYIQFEEEQQQRFNVCSLFCRALACPIKEVDKYLAGLQKFVQTASLPDMMTTEEADAIRVKVAAEKEAGGTGADGDEDMEPAPPASAEVTDDEVKESWLQDKQKLHQASRKELGLLEPFCRNLKRPYFHVKPLDAAQLSTWLKYLAFMEGRDDVAACSTVYERCLVPCASYPEFWERYVIWLESKALMEAAELAVQRMTSTFCRSNADAHMFAARFDERRGAVDSARERYKTNQVAPKLLSFIDAAANFERRQGNREGACAAFEDVLKAERAKDAPSSSVVPYVSLHFAKFLRLAYKDVEAGRKVIDAALQEYPDNKMLWEGAVFFEEAVGGSEAMARAMHLIETCAADPDSQPEAEPASDATTATPPSGSAASGAQAKSSSSSKHLSRGEREGLSMRAVDLAALHGTPEQLLVAERNHFTRFTMQSCIAPPLEAGSRKRAQDLSPAAYDEPSNKVMRTEASSASAHTPHHWPAQPSGAAPPSAGYPSAAAGQAGYYGSSGAYQYPGYGQHQGYQGYPAATYGQYGAYPASNGT